MSASPPLKKRSEPRQGRSEKTYDLILATAAELLEEVGFERLSTNMICKRAGLTPPALYRYFPNKYAVLKELGEQLMRTQNELFEGMEPRSFSKDDIEHTILDVLVATVAVTRAQTAGAWIMRSLHASPVLAEVRINSHRQAAQFLTSLIRARNETLDQDQVYAKSRLGVELGYAAIEMVFDETELDEAELLAEAANMLARTVVRILQEA